MPPQNDNRLTAWVLLIKDEWLPAQRQRISEWFGAVRAEPRLAWETPALRYSVYGLGGLTVLLLAWWFASWMAPPPPPDARPRAKTATFHAVCTDSECGHHFMIERKFSFKKFPVQCPKCKRDTGERALRCPSDQCRGKHVVVVRDGDAMRCSECGSPLGPRR